MVSREIFMANQTCPRCGTEALPEYKFCLKCGAPLTGGEGDPAGTHAASKARLILINLQPTRLDSIADVAIHADVAQILPRLVNGLR